MAAAERFMRQHFDKKLTVSEIARHVGLERSYFSRRFKQAFGESPYEFILNLRVNRAKQLLRDTAYTIEHIALIVGFHDVFHFSNAFKHKVRVSPSGYRSGK